MYMALTCLAHIIKVSVVLQQYFKTVCTLIRLSSAQWHFVRLDCVTLCVLFRFSFTH